MAQVQIDNIKWPTRRRRGRPVVLIHGYPFNRSLWNEQIAALSGSYRVIAPDLRGFGESDSSDGPSTMNRMAQDVACCWTISEFRARRSARCRWAGMYARVL
jgi:pimeloyl-ACP methyl ester carboxylesterase